MKQIKCSECSKIWYTNDDDTSFLIICPFCIKEIQKKVKITDIDNLGKGIYQAVSDKGLEILSSVGRITGFLLDIAQNVELKREVKIFSKTFNDDYLKIYQEVFDKGLENAESTLKRLERIFIDEEGLSEEWAKILYENCLKAVKYYKGMGENLVLSIEVTDFNRKIKNDRNSCKEDYHGKTENDFVRYIDGAKEGDAKAQFIIGRCYDNGTGVKEDQEKAFEWYMKVAEQRSSKAQYAVGNCYFFGKGIAENLEKAFEWYIKAAKQGHFKAQYEVGNCYHYGRGTIENLEKAFEWYIKAAKQGHCKARYEVGNCYHYGSGIAKDEEKAFEWYIKAAEQGDLEAQYAVGNCYSGAGGVANNSEKAFE